MKLILVMSSMDNANNLLKIIKAASQLNKKDFILYSGTSIKCIEARAILNDLGIKQSRILIDIKSKGTRHFVKEYMNDYKELTLISENVMEEKLIRSMYNGKLNIVRI